MFWPNVTTQPAKLRWPYSHPERMPLPDTTPQFKTDVIPPELASVTEIASFNYRFTDYEAYLKHEPNLIIYQSEATTNDLLKPYFGMDRDKMVGLGLLGGY